MDQRVTSLETLVGDGTVAVAQLPPDNGDLGGTNPKTVPILGEDYPARTAKLWNEVYRILDLPDRNVMVVANPADAPRILNAFRADPRYMGGGAGAGFKEVVLPLLDEVTPLARAMGAVNIIKKTEGGTLVGHNTDGMGYVESLEQTLKTQSKTIAGAHIVVLGAGGTGRSVSMALADKGARITILNRTVSKAVDLARMVNDYVDNRLATGGGRNLIKRFIPAADAVVSVVDDIHSPLDEYSPLGDMLAPVTPEPVGHNLAQSKEMLTLLKPDCVISDIRIRKEQTPMLAQATRLGYPVLDGLPMVTNQAIEAFWWIYGDMLIARGHRKGDVAEIMRHV